MNYSFVFKEANSDGTMIQCYYMGYYLAKCRNYRESTICPSWVVLLVYFHTPIHHVAYITCRIMLFCSSNHFQLYCGRFKYVNMTEQQNVLRCCARGNRTRTGDFEVIRPGPMYASGLFMFNSSFNSFFFFFYLSLFHLMLKMYTCRGS